MYEQYLKKIKLYIENWGISMFTLVDHTIYWQTY